jgi:DNA-binding response OmpR family regulator
MSVRCLIVDDSPSFLDVARKILERGGFTVVGGASTSAEALRQAGELDPDIVLVDIVLGSESGFSLARRLTAMSGPERPNIILISTHGGEDFSDLIEESPAIGFLPKWRLSARAITELLEERRERE